MPPSPFDALVPRRRFAAWDPATRKLAVLDVDGTVSAVARGPVSARQSAGASHERS